MEAYCSYEISKLLKEKGFNEKCYGGYHLEFDDNDNSVLMFEKWITYPHNNDFEDEGFLCSAPTHQMAMKWLREVHNQHVQIKYFHGAYQEFEYVIINTFNGKAYHKPEGFFSYEEACEEGIKYCLENLI